jgi:hypothetical protein
VATTFASTTMQTQKLSRSLSLALTTACLLVCASGCKKGEEPSAPGAAESKSAGTAPTAASLVGSWKVTGGDATSKGVVYKFDADGNVTLSGMTKCQYGTAGSVLTMTCGGVKLTYTAAVQGDGTLVLAGAGDTSGNMTLTKS